MSGKIKRYDSLYRPDEMCESREGEWVEYSDYEKLLAKYNGIFEWICNNGNQIEYFDSVEEIKTSYEEGLK
jgi:hypothetical protein